MSKCACGPGLLRNLLPQLQVGPLQPVIIDTPAKSYTTVMLTDLAFRGLHFRGLIARP